MIKNKKLILNIFLTIFFIKTKVINSISKLMNESRFIQMDNRLSNEFNLKSIMHILEKKLKRELTDNEIKILKNLNLDHFEISKTISNFSKIINELKDEDPNLIDFYIINKIFFDAKKNIEKQLNKKLEKDEIELLGRIASSNPHGNISDLVEEYKKTLSLKENMNQNKIILPLYILEKSIISNDEIIPLYSENSKNSGKKLLKSSKKYSKKIQSSLDLSDDSKKLIKKYLINFKNKKDFKDLNFSENEENKIISFLTKHKIGNVEIEILKDVFTHLNLENNDLLFNIINDDEKRNSILEKWLKELE